MRTATPPQRRAAGAFFLSALCATLLAPESHAQITFSNLLEEIFGVEVPVGVIINPAGNVALLADYIEASRSSGGRPTFATVHAPDSAEVHAGELTLGKFIPAEIAKWSAISKRVGAKAE